MTSLGTDSRFSLRMNCPYVKLASGRARALMSDCSARGEVSNGLCQSSSTEHEHQARHASRHLFSDLINISHYIVIRKGARVYVPRRAQIFEHVDQQLRRKHRRRRRPARQRPRSILPRESSGLGHKDVQVIRILETRRALARRVIHPRRSGTSCPQRVLHALPLALMPIPSLPDYHHLQFLSSEPVVAWHDPCAEKSSSSNAACSCCML